MKKLISSACKATLLGMASVLLVSPVNAQEAEVKKVYAPPANIRQNVYFGDAHIHTTLSVDAALWGTKLRPEDVYRYARGEEVTSSKGWKTKLRRPLEWTVVADHSDAMGFYSFIEEGADFIVAVPQGATWFQMLKDGKNKQVADELIKNFGAGDIPWEINKPEYMKISWEETVGAAEAANDPGNFTAFISYEWTCESERRQQSSGRHL